MALARNPLPRRRTEAAGKHSLGSHLERQRGSPVTQSSPPRAAGGGTGLSALSRLPAGGRWRTAGLQGAFWPLGANWGHQLGLRLWPAPLPRCLHSGGGRERLDKPAHPGVTAAWLPKGQQGLQDTPRARVKAGVGGQQERGAVCLFSYNKHTFALSCWVSIFLSPEVGEAGKQDSQRRGYYLVFGSAMESHFQASSHFIPFSV